MTANFLTDLKVWVQFCTCPELRSNPPVIHIVLSSTNYCQK